jgi:hypothetical protein
MSAISSACSPVSGWDTRRSSTLTPRLLCIGRVQRVFGINEGGGAALLLRLGDDLTGSVWSCRRTPGRRSRPRDRAAVRQHPARCPGSASRWRSRRCRAPGRHRPCASRHPCRTVFSIWLSAAPKALRLLSSIVFSPLLAVCTRPIRGRRSKIRVAAIIPPPHPVNHRDNPRVPGRWTPELRENRELRASPARADGCRGGYCGFIQYPEMPCNCPLRWPATASGRAPGRHCHAPRSPTPPGRTPRPARRWVGYHGAGVPPVPCGSG